MLPWYIKMYYDVSAGCWLVGELHELSGIFSRLKHIQIYLPTFLHLSHLSPKQMMEKCCCFYLIHLFISLFVRDNAGTILLNYITCKDVLHVGFLVRFFGLWLIWAHNKQFKNVLKGVWYIQNNSHSDRQYVSDRSSIETLSSANAAGRIQRQHIREELSRQEEVDNTMALQSGQRPNKLSHASWNNVFFFCRVSWDLEIIQ